MKPVLPQDHPWADRIHCFETIDSTNTRAKAMAAQGAPQGTVILAREQTAGRGRLGRSFHSAAGKGIYLSLILRPNCPPGSLMHLTCAVAVAARDALQAHLGDASDVKIKWINDLVYGRKKIGGILTELALDSKTGLVSHAVIGIGINYHHRTEDFPPELRDKAASISMFHPGKDPADLTANLILALERMDRTLLTGKAAMMDRYREACMTLGQPVSIHGTGDVRHGVALDVDEDGGLLVRFPDGHTETVASGEVSVRGMYGYV